MPYHHGSTRGSGAQIRLDRKEAARFRYRLHCLARLPVRDPRHISPKAEWVGLALLSHLSSAGRCDPSQERLAEIARVCVKTVTAALARLRRLGVIAWQRRVRRAGRGWRQTSNAYVLAPLGEPIALPAPRRPKQSLESSSPAPSTLATILAALPAPTRSLAEITAERIALFNARWAAGERPESAVNRAPRPPSARPVG